MRFFNIKEWINNNRYSFLEFIHENRYLVFTIVCISFIAILFLIIYTRILKNQVDKSTKQLRKANMNLLENQKEMYNLAYYDDITSLPNRSKFKMELEKRLDISDIDNDIFGVLFLDLDKFKHINDTLGHSVGDEVLKFLSIRLTRVLNNRGTLYKAGGDEYFILTKNIDNRAQIEILAKEIIEDFKNAYNIRDYNLYITTSIGIAIYPKSGVDALNIIKNSDLALYKAKEVGGNSYYIYGREIESKGLYSMQLLNELRQGIENDELILYYQPQIDIKTERLIGFEALVRWNHPTRGIISPDKFITLAEESELIIPIGNSILKRVCVQTKEWIDRCGDIIISVNISAKQFQHKDFLNEVKNSLKVANLDPKYLAIEITETIAIYNMEYTLSILNELNELGIIVSIDDFGTGYSSLNYLNEMNVKELKIDKSFICDIGENLNNRSITNVIIILAKQLGLKVVAEGVETEEQFNILKEMECDMAQGYYFSKPLRKEEVCGFIDSGSIYEIK